ncbi:MAG: stage III sporulation protein AF [Acutalibacteraceae bacterium]
MEEITQWANAVCVVAVVCSIIELVAPKGEINKMINFILGLFLVVSVLFPVANSLKLDNFRIDKMENYSQNFTFQKDTDNLTIQVGKSAIEKLIANALDQQNINYKKIIVNMDSSTGNSIDIIRAEIYVDKSYRNNLIQVQDIVEKSIGIKPSVYVG